MHSRIKKNKQLRKSKKKSQDNKTSKMKKKLMWKMLREEKTNAMRE